MLLHVREITNEEELRTYIRRYRELESTFRMECSKHHVSEFKKDEFLMTACDATISLYWIAQLKLDIYSYVQNSPMTLEEFADIVKEECAFSLM